MLRLLNFTDHLLPLRIIILKPPPDHRLPRHVYHMPRLSEIHVVQQLLTDRSCTVSIFVWSTPARKRHVRKGFSAHLGSLKLPRFVFFTLETFFTPRPMTYPTLTYPTLKYPTLTYPALSNSSPTMPSPYLSKSLLNPSFRLELKPNEPFVDAKWLGDHSPYEIKLEIVPLNHWAKINKIIESKNTLMFLKSFCSDLTTASRILTDEILSFSTNISQFQCEPEEFNHNLICYKCYKYDDHPTKDC